MLLSTFIVFSHFLCVMENKYRALRLQAAAPLSHAVASGSIALHSSAVWTGKLIYTTGKRICPAGVWGNDGEWESRAAVAHTQENKDFLLI